MSKLLTKVNQVSPKNAKGKFERFNLSENPFPSEPAVNKNSTDKRINGHIFETEIRRKEFEQIKENFLTQPQSDPNHLRLGMLVDNSYIGRGNGKSTFLINLSEKINQEYCLDLSKNLNKCFSIYISPEPGGRTKTFYNFIDLIAYSLIDSGIINNCLAVLRFEAIQGISKYQKFTSKFNNDEEMVSSLNSFEWFEKNKVSLLDINEFVIKNEYLQTLPPEFPIFLDKFQLIQKLVTQSDFIDYYHELKKGKDRLDFIFTHLLSLFIAAGFNGAYLLIDDFERIPAFQSARQKKDFALELRSCFYDGVYLNAKVGFYNLFLVFHAGVPRLISEAWAESGMDSRSPILPAVASKHIILFDKLSKDHAKLLIKKYLDEYRHTPTKSALTPFTGEVIAKMGEICEYNASKILNLAYNLLDKISDDSKQDLIDLEFLNKNLENFNASNDLSTTTIDNTESTDLIKKAKGEIK